MQLLARGDRREIDMEESARSKMKQKLLQYPDAAEAEVEDRLDKYEEREIFKNTLIEERGFSNSQAEKFLDRQGFPRPPGWHSVLFYPGGTSLRPGVVILLVAIVAGIWMFTD